MGSAISTIIIGIVDWSSSTNLEYAQKLRSQASDHFKSAKDLSQRSQSAYASNNKSLAKSLSLEKAAGYTQAEELNTRAAALIFKHFNPDAKDLSRIDLHGLYVKEAERYLEERIAGLKKAGKRVKLVVVTGQGNHSKDGVAVIKPIIETFARERGLCGRV
jgi:DNA-nicking Smr family endonuclease